MSLSAVKVLGINVTTSSKKDILEDIYKYLNSPAKTRQKSYKIVTPNPEQIVYAQHDPRFADIINRADVAIPDGSGLVWADPKNISQVIPGVDFFEELVSGCAKRIVPIALIGGQEKVALNAFECLRQKYQGLTGVALGAPSFTVEPSGLAMEGDIDRYFADLAGTLGREHVGLVAVGLGAPKQEYFIERLCREMSFRPLSRNPQSTDWIPGQARDDRGIILMSVGGSLDMLSGKISRSPDTFRKFHIPFFGGAVTGEFLWRLMKEPWRWRRQLALMKFVWRVLLKRYRL